MKRLTAAATVGAFALVAVTHPVVADAAALITSANIADGTIGSIDIRDDGLGSRDIRDDTLGSRDIKDETLLRTDFRPGVLPTEQPAPSTVTTLRSWTVHFDASVDGRPLSVTSTATLPPGTAISGVDVRGGDISTCPNQTVYLSINGRNPFLSAYRTAGGEWAGRGYAPDRVMSGSPDTLQAEVYCANNNGSTPPSAALDVTFLFETTTPAAAPATPFD